jgi:molecular chaperone DnaK (HSP70)
MFYSNVVRFTKITIARDGARSSADIDRMIKEAEAMAEQDKAAREKIEARNGLENYVYQVKNTLNDEKSKGKISDEVKQEENLLFCLFS